MDCIECGSRGCPAVVPTIIKVDPKHTEVQAVYADGLNRLRVSYENALRGVVAQQRSGRLTRDQATTAFNKIAVEHADKLKKTLEAMPKAEDAITETAACCPWCKHEELVVVRPLADDAVQPPTWEPKKVRA